MFSPVTQAVWPLNMVSKISIFSISNCTKRSICSLFTKPSRNPSVQKATTTAVLSTAFFSSSFRSLTTARRNMSQTTEDEWRVKLSPQQFKVLREKHTEAPFTGEYDKHYDDGVYTCAACNAPLYKSGTKFKSGCGWPAFFEGIPGAITEVVDESHGIARIEIVCSNCKGHLGHVFRGEGYNTPTDERHCVNSISLKFDKESK